MMVTVTEQEKRVGNGHLQNIKASVSCVSKAAGDRAESSSSRENALKVGCSLLGGLTEETKGVKEMKEAG